MMYGKNTGVLLAVLALFFAVISLICALMELHSQRGH